MFVSEAIGGTNSDENIRDSSRSQKPFAEPLESRYPSLDSGHLIITTRRNGARSWYSVAF